MQITSYRSNLPSSNPNCLEDVELPEPVVGPRDLLVKVEAVSINPVDTKVRQNANPHGEPKVLGWDAAGTVIQKGADVSLFELGDEVYCSGAFDRPGTNAELFAVDERFAGHKPQTLSFAEAAALPLTTLTAWEALFDQLGLVRGENGAAQLLLITAAAGGVGSMALQLARQLTNATVIGTSSRPQTTAWAHKMGAHHVINHREPLAGQVRAIAPGGIHYALSVSSTDQHFEALSDLLAPFGKMVVLDEPSSIDVLKLKWKSIALLWHVVFTRSLYDTPDRFKQHDILNAVAGYIDSGLIKTTLTRNLGAINAANVRRAHEMIETGQTIGKVVLAGF